MAAALGKALIVSQAPAIGGAAADTFDIIRTARTEGTETEAQAVGRTLKNVGKSAVNIFTSAVGLGKVFKKDTTAEQEVANARNEALAVQNANAFKRVVTPGQVITREQQLGRLVTSNNIQVPELIKANNRSIAGRVNVNQIFPRGAFPVTALSTGGLQRLIENKISTLTEPVILKPDQTVIGFNETVKPTGKKTVVKRKPRKTTKAPSSDIIIL